MSDAAAPASGSEPAGPPDPVARPLRIVIGADTFPPEINGSARFSSVLAGQLARRGHDVHVVAPSATGRPVTHTEVFEGADVTVHRLRSWRWYPHPWLRFALPWRIEQNAARILDEVRPDVVHFQSHIVTGRGLSHQAQLRGIRLIGTNHVMPENLIEHSPIPKRLHAWAYRMFWDAAARSYTRAAVLTSPTRRAADFLEKYIRVSGVLALSNGVVMSNYTPVIAPRSDRLILFVGRITGEKRLEVLLDAFAKLDPSLGARLELVGGGEGEGHLRAYARRLGVGDRVTITGYVSEEYLREAYTRAAVFAMPSTAELQSIATMEAMASALPVVGADAMALPHLVHDGENGYLFEPDNADDLAARLTDVLTAEPAEYERMQRESLRIVTDHDIATTVSTFEAIYRGEQVSDTIKEPPPPRKVRASLQALREKLSRGE
ncbi:glycosyltransferase [Galbitalea sp. SE-J8]|uniref:glycosyltransferase n=1 Tax=Galbitalea sp. SE-J8 TaxID=3054952 RepID=UPI00259C8C1C|nr:glycosyltransferase [Galbitalea sp. SE-J8]MDM4761871.1 glycosyltransferase [Galbitalea sp. SE-J8]